MTTTTETNTMTMTSPNGTSYTKTMNYKRTIEIAGGVFEFYGKVRFPGEKAFWFEGSGGSVTNRVFHAVHHTIDKFDDIADALAEYGAVAEYRVYQRRSEGKAPRLLRTYTFNTEN